MFRSRIKIQSDFLVRQNSSGERITKQHRILGQIKIDMDKNESQIGLEKQNFNQQKSYRVRVFLWPIGIERQFPYNRLIEHSSFLSQGKIGFTNPPEYLQRCKIFSRRSKHVHV